MIIAVIICGSALMILVAACIVGEKLERMSKALWDLNESRKFIEEFSRRGLWEAQALHREWQRATLGQPLTFVPETLIRSGHVDGTFGAGHTVFTSVVDTPTDVVFPGKAAAR